MDYWRARNAGYHQCIDSLARFYVPRRARVLEVGCGTDDLRASVEPSEGDGIDLSAAMVARALERYAHLHRAREVGIGKRPAALLSLRG